MDVRVIFHSDKTTKTTGTSIYRMTEHGLQELSKREAQEELSNPNINQIARLTRSTKTIILPSRTRPMWEALNLQTLIRNPGRLANRSSPTTRELMARDVKPIIERAIEDIAKHKTELKSRVRQEESEEIFRDLIDFFLQYNQIATEIPDSFLEVITDQ